MNVDQLFEEARRLVRPSTWLIPQTTGEGVAAVWDGPGVLSAPVGPFVHRITIDCRFLPQPIPGVSGYIGVYLNSDDDEHSLLLHQPAAIDLTAAEGIKLSPQPMLSWPPVEAIFRFGSPLVDDWLQSNGWQRDWEYNDNFPDSTVAEAYNQIWQDGHPLYTQSATAVLGGWHFAWPDGDWADLLDQRLIVWTLEDAEPWIEVWYDNYGQFRLIERVT